MVIVLGGMAAAVLALQRLWKHLTRQEPGTPSTVSTEQATKVKLGTNLLIVVAQAVGYVVELLSGSRSAPPGTKPPDSQSPFTRTAASIGAA